jgi:N6-L-threonylcarbamoyladenine synthase
MLVLGIETSCDETGASVVKDGREILSNVVASSLDFHRRYGGIVPEIATRYHIEVINYVVRNSLRKAGVKLGGVDLIAVTCGPGLVGALLVGISFAKSLSFSLGIPLIGVNHLWSHIYSGLIGRRGVKYPFIGLVISGGHTCLVFCEDIGKFKLLGQTKDDAVGEAFDKVAKVLKLGYPGGPAIERAACNGDPDAIRFAPTYLDEVSYDFSFSGIKTAVLYYIRKKRLNKRLKSDVVASFQKAVFESLVEKSIDACKFRGVESLVVGGGVSANKYLRAILINAGLKNGIDVIFPPFELSLDNAAMVAALGYSLFKKEIRSDLYLTAEPNLKI